jgi:hypothetical protein
MAFGQNLRKPAAPPAQRTGTARKSRYQGAKLQGAREPVPHVGAYRFLVHDANEGRTGDTFKGFLEIVNLDEEAQQYHKVGDQVIVLFKLVGKQGTAEMGMGRVKDLTMAAAGFSDEAEFDTFDNGASGEFIAAFLGEANEFSAEGRPVVGRHVDCLVSRGADKGDGDYYREFSWVPVPDVATDDDPGQPETAPRYPLGVS